jgi:UDP-GlcNAc3NAcA epimerase
MHLGKPDLKILSIVGARPQFIKAAAFRKYCDEHNISETLIHTGQHYDPIMSTQLFDELGVRAPDIKFEVTDRSHAGMTGELMKKIEDAIIEVKPDIVNVYGDTNSTLAGALAAAKLHVPIMHVEAGLRSFNRNMPEEINRVLVDHVSKYLFCPTKAAVTNLKSEGISEGVYHVGDIMFDCTLMFEEKFRFPEKKILQSDKPIALMTVHRADTTSDPQRLKSVLDYCANFSDEYQIIFPIHPNTKNVAQKFSIDLSNFCIVDPLSYLEIQAVLSLSTLLLTDSGGMQKEAYFHSVDCITLRDETEWVETIDAGWNMLWTQNTRQPKSSISEYGTGKTCADMIKKIEETLK